MTLTTDTQRTTEASHVSLMCVPTPNVSTPLITMKEKLYINSQDCGRERVQSKLALVYSNEGLLSRYL